MAADPLSLIPPGSQYDNLRSALRILRRDFPQDYAGLVNQESRVSGWVDEVDRIKAGNPRPGDRDADQIRDDIVEHIIGEEAAIRVYGITAEEFQLLILGGNEGGINLGDQTPVVEPEPIEPPTPPPPEEPPIPEPEPEPEPEPLDYRRIVAELYPWLPPELVKIFADEWARTGDQELALAHMRSARRNIGDDQVGGGSPDPNDVIGAGGGGVPGKNIYDTYFPGNRRKDGSLRHTEQEWFAIMEAYRRLIIEFGLNADLFEGHFVKLMEGSVSPNELAGRLGSAYERIITNIPEVKEFYARQFGLELTDAAIFASFLDPDIGDAILNRRISVAQVGGEGLARGFDVTAAFAGRLANAGIDQETARGFFTNAEGRVPTLNELARRFADPDSDFDVTEFADAAIFGDASARRRVRRLLAGESSLFSDQFGAVALSDEFAVTGITAR